MKKRLLAVTLSTLALSIFCASTYASDSICSNPSSKMVSPITTKQFLMVSFLKDSTMAYDKIAPLVKGEAQLAWDYYSTGRVQQMYGRLDQTGVVILWNAKNSTDAEKAIKQMPMVQAGFIGHTLIPVQHFSLCSLFNTGTQSSAPQPTTAKSQQFVVITTPETKVTTSQIKAQSKNETLAVWNHYQTGIVRSMFDSSPSKLGSSVLVITANDVDDATQIVEELPFVQNHLVKYQLIPVGYFFPLGALF
jgi:hypothetical protein